MNEKEFIVAVKELGIEITDLQLKQLESFYELLIQWNQKMNLTRITEKRMSI